MTNAIAKIDPTFAEMMGVKNLWTTLDVQTQEGCNRLAVALDSNNPKLDGVINTTLSITDLVTRDMEGKPDEHGEVDDYMSITLICSDGKCYFTGARGIRQSLFLASLRRGKPPWNPPLQCIVRQKTFNLNNGQPGRTYYLEFLDAKPEPQGKKGNA